MDELPVQPRIFLAYDEDCIYIPVSLASDPYSFTEVLVYQHSKHVFDEDMFFESGDFPVPEKKQLLCLPFMDGCDPTCTTAHSTEATTRRDKSWAKGKK